MQFKAGTLNTVEMLFKFGVEDTRVQLNWKRVVVLILFCGLLVFSILVVYPHMNEEEFKAGKTFLANNLYSSKLITRVNTGGEKVVALTFDDGPDPRYTPDVLNIMAQNQVKATFFVIGKSAERFPGLVEQAVMEGHEIENHTYSHPDLDKSEMISTYEELDRCEQIITKLAGRRPEYFRPPKRLYNNEVIKTAELNDYQVILWTVGMEKQSDRNADDVVNRVMKKIEPGAIILAHDGTLDRRLTVEALPVLLKKLQEKGYRLVTLKELMVYHQE